MTSKPSYQITPHPLGSLREIWTLSWPLILGFVSNGMMVFVDRVMLGRYSVSAMNASATAGSAAFAFLILPMVIAGISEVFVGRFNGEGKFHRIGSAVWQMVWFSILMAPIFFLMGSYLPPLLFNHTQSPELNGEYFYWLTTFGTFFCLTKAFLGFYVGQGRVKIVAVSVLVANVLNIGLDYLLIYGSPISPALGVKGAAIATLSTEAMMAFALFIFFIRKKNRILKGAGRYQIKPYLFMNSLKLGLSASLAHLSEYVGYFVFLNWLNARDEAFLTIMVILQTFYMLFFFVIEGVSKGITAVVSNLIGANKYEYISKSLKSTFKLHLIFVGLVSAVMLLFSPGVFSIFVSQSNHGFFSDPVFLKQLYTSSLYLCLFYIFDGMLWTLVGILVAAQDSRFIMIAGTLGPWLLSVLPIYIGIEYFNIRVDQVWLLLVLYSLSFTFVYWARYRRAPWKRAPASSEKANLPTQ